MSARDSSTKASSARPWKLMAATLILCSWQERSRFRATMEVRDEQHQSRQVRSLVEAAPHTLPFRPSPPSTGGGNHALHQSCCFADDPLRGDQEDKQRQEDPVTEQRVFLRLGEQA